VGTSKSAVSAGWPDPPGGPSPRSRFVAATETALAELVSRRLDELDLLR
jgi:hypothetical protein